MVTEVHHEFCGPMKLVSPPVKFSDVGPSVRSPPPVLGQHTAEILEQVLGMQKEEIQSLKKEGAVS